MKSETEDITHRGTSLNS